MMEKDEVIIDFELNYEGTQSVGKAFDNIKIIIFLTKILPIIVLVFCEVYLILICVKVGFTTGYIIYIVCYPFIFGFLVFIVPKIVLRFIQRIILNPKKLDKLILVNAATAYPINSNFIFNDEGIFANLADTTYTLKWANLTKIAEIDVFYHLHLPQFTTLVIPKSAFTQNQINKFHTLILNNLDKKKIKIALSAKERGIIDS